MKPSTIMIMLVCLLIVLIAALPILANLRIMSYNIKDFWLRFDGEPGTITDKGAELNQDDLKKLEIIASIVNEKKPDVIGILECASLGELIFFNERFLEDSYRCWSFRTYDSRSYGIPLGIMISKDLEVSSVKLVEPSSFSLRGIIVADIAKDKYEFTLILVHLKSKIESKLGDSALKRDRQGDRLREIIGEKLESDPEANIIICGDFNDFPGRDEQEEAAEVEDLIAKMMIPVILPDEIEVAVYGPTLDSSDLDVNGELWTEKTKDYGTVLFDYFFLTEGAEEDFIGIDHVYPEEFEGIEEASDHIPIVLDLGRE